MSQWQSLSLAWVSRRRSRAVNSQSGALGKSNTPRQPKSDLLDGRHTPHAGSANIGGGVTIDLQSLNDVTVSSDQKIVSLGPGNRWGNVYPKLDALGLAMVGGRVSTVGVGGLVTGGAYQISSLWAHSNIFQAAYLSSPDAMASLVTIS
jgi:hypothetical protein